MSVSLDLNKELVQASKCGDLATVKYLVEERKVDPRNCKDTSGYDDTPLHLASYTGHIDIVKYLIEGMGCDVACRNKLGNTPLHAAAFKGALDIVQYLIVERGCDPMIRSLTGLTPLHFACQQGHLNVVKYLAIDQKVDVSCLNYSAGATPLHLAAQFGSLDVVKYLTEELKCDVMCRNAQLGSTPLHYAVVGDKLEIVQYLIESQKVEPSCRDKKDNTPLHYASRKGHLAVVKSLIEDYQCDLDVKDGNGQTPLEVAKSQRMTHITSYLSSIEKVVSSYLRKALVHQLKSYTRKAKATGKLLGSGTYGSVVELTLAGETVAGKIFKVSSYIHQQAIVNRLCAELILTIQLRHQNIVQCKGVCFLVDQHLPVLLMERLMTNLHTFLLDPSNFSLSLQRKVSILHDVASGLAYLHSQIPAVIHRDLTGKNILLDSKQSAKISDFGNSRIIDLDPEASPETLTSLPGTLEYMPPEAQGGNPHYTVSLDVFSFGHLSLFTTIQTPVFPLLPPSYTDAAGAHVRVEVKRRKEYLDKAEQLLGGKHLLFVLIKQCLHNDPALRPHAVDLVTRLQNIPDSTLPFQSPFGDCETSTTAPRLAQLKVMRTKDGQKVEIIKSVAHRWKDVGTLLDFDPTGNQLNLIEADKVKEGPVSCCQFMFQYWLEGNGVKPVTWDKLIEILEDSNFVTLAEQVKLAIQT